MSSILLDLESSLTAGVSIVGNKAHNLSLLRYGVGIENVLACLVLSFIDSKSPDERMLEILSEVNGEFRFPIIARSSADVEDSTVSFAGQFVSSVCNDEDELKKAIFSIVNSTGSHNVKAYCKAKEIDPDTINMAVMFQPYLSAEMSGVMFTKDPVSNDKNKILIEYAKNSSDAVTAGHTMPQSIYLKKSAVEDAEMPFRELAQIGKQAEEYFGNPMDIEWIVSSGKLWIVQARQITT